MHNALGLTDPMPTEVSSFHERPYQVIHGEVFSAKRSLGRSRDPEVNGDRRKTLIGSLDQFSDSTDLRENTSLQAALRALYR